MTFSLPKRRSSISMLHPHAKVLAMFAFDSYSQSKRSPRPLSRHRPCKTPFPIGNATFNKLPRFYLIWVFLINWQWNAGFIQPFLPRIAESASSPSIVATATICHKVCVMSTGGKKRGPKRGQNEVRIMAHSYTYGIHNLSIRSDKAGAQCRSCKTKQPTMPNTLRQQP